LFYSPIRNSMQIVLPSPRTFSWHCTSHNHSSSHMIQLLFKLITRKFEYVLNVISLEITGHRYIQITMFCSVSHSTIQYLHTPVGNIHSYNSTIRYMHDTYDMPLWSHIYTYISIKAVLSIFGWNSKSNIILYYDVCE
jgi:hypothetical protein